MTTLRMIERCNSLMVLIVSLMVTPGGIQVGGTRSTIAWLFEVEIGE